MFFAEACSPDEACIDRGIDGIEKIGAQIIGLKSVLFVMPNFARFFDSKEAGTSLNWTAELLEFVRKLSRSGTI